MKTTSIFRYTLGVLVGGLLLVAPLFQAQAMTISPVRIELAGDPGATVNSTFKVINEEDEAKTLYTTFENFEATGETGSPKFVPGAKGLANWITAQTEVTVNPGETELIDFSVSIPSDAEPGGYFAAIFLGTTPPVAGSNELAIGARIGTLLLFRVNGDVEEGGALLEFATLDQQKLFSALPINLYYRFQNTGADRVMPKGTMTIKNTFGSSTTVIDANSVEGNVLPRSIRRFELWWQKGEQVSNPVSQPEGQGFFEAVKYEWNNFAFGRYTANLDIQYGSQGEKVTNNFSFFVFPWQLLVVELVILLILIFGLNFIIKSYNRWVIKRARR